MEIQESDNFKAQETQREEPINFFFFSVADVCLQFQS